MSFCNSRTERTNHNCVGLIMSEEKIDIEGYRFRNFRLERDDTTVYFTVDITEDRFANENDAQIVSRILDDMGKWESLVKASLHLLSDLRLRQIEPTILQSYEKPSGIELYEVGMKKVGESSLEGEIHIRREERHKREHLKITPIFTVEEVTSQLVNIPKWRAFKKAMLIIKEQFC
jgi:hypothetical protein